MGGIIQVDSVLNNNTSNLITQTNSTTITIGSTGQTISLASGASSSGFGLAWNQTVQTTNFTASVNVGYMVNTTTAAITVTLPAAPSIGDQISIVDFNETAATNNITLNPNGLKIDGTTDNTLINKSGEGVTILYTGTTRGWIPVSAANEGTQALVSPISLDFLVVGGGGGAVNGNNPEGTGGGGAGGFRTSTQIALPGTVITVTVGSGGTGSAYQTNIKSNGTSSSISGSGLTTISSAGGGSGGIGTSAGAPDASGNSGGSGGGGSFNTAGGSGNTPSTSPSQGNNGGTGYQQGSPFICSGGGGGGAGAVGANAAAGGAGNGGIGSTSSITGTSTYYAGGGGGGTNSGSSGTGGNGGGGTEGNNGTANTGGGAGGNSFMANGKNGGSGVVIISVATVHYTGTSSGSPTVTTSGSNTILKFTGSGSYTV
jgi:hypothetical protein